MGVAAYNRASHCIRQRIATDARPREFLMMDDLNSQQKYPDAGFINERVTFTRARGLWWVETERLGSAGYGYWYKSLREAVRRWRVTITEYKNGVWIGIPVDAQEEAKHE